MSLIEAMIKAGWTNTDAHANDLISRQAAIEVVDEYMNRLTSHIGTPTDNERYAYARGALLGVERGINALPSAQPEIIRCKDCMHYNAGFECLIEGYGIERNKDWFCGDAERRTDG